MTEQSATLQCPPHPPVMLSMSEETLIGRDKSCQLVVPASLVSRRHASVSWNGTVFVLRDLDSSNGTYLNDEQVEMGILTSGDQIKIGTFTIIFSEGESPASTPTNSQEKTLSVDLGAGRNMRGLSGSVRDISLIQVLETLEIEARTGVLTVRDGGRKGEIGVSNGRLVSAAHGSQRGKAALLSLISLEEGNFEFDPKMKPEEFMNHRIQDLLSEFFDDASGAS